MKVTIAAFVYLAPAEDCCIIPRRGVRCNAGGELTRRLSVKQEKRNPVGHCPHGYGASWSVYVYWLFRRTCSFHYRDGSSAQMMDVEGFCHVSEHGVISQKTILKKEACLPFDWDAAVFF